MLFRSALVDKALRCRKYHLAHFPAATDPCPSKSLAVSLKHSSDDLEAVLTRSSLPLLPPLRES